MAAEEAHAGESGAAETGGGGSALSIEVILGAVNALVVLAAVGLLVYTRLIYKRPQITEENERARIAAEKDKAAPAPSSGFVNFEAMTINIAPSVPQGKSADDGQSGHSGQIQGKLHYATIGFSLELPDMSRSTEVDALKPLILDQFLGVVGRKQFQDLTSIEGRYVLKTQLIDLANDLAKKRLTEKGGSSAEDDRGPLVSNLYFNEFIVQ